MALCCLLHLSPRDELSTHPEDDMSQPLTGVFSTCSPNRPNPIGLHRARIVARDGLRIEVDALEASGRSARQHRRELLLAFLAEAMRNCRVWATRWPGPVG
jgi:hypothetical protein